jgi:hypothetical protein
MRDIIQFDIRNGFQLQFIMSGLTPDDVVTLRRGPAEFALYEHRSLLFFLSRFAKFGDWCDSPFSLHRYSQPLPELGLDPAGNALVCTFYERNGAELRQRGARLFGLPHTFSNHLHEVIHRQAAAPMDDKTYFALINEAYAQHTPYDMSAQAKFRCEFPGLKKDD